MSGCFAEGVFKTHRNYKVDDDNLHIHYCFLACVESPHFNPVCMLNSQDKCHKSRLWEWAWESSIHSAAISFLLLNSTYGQSDSPASVFRRSVVLWKWIKVTAGFPSSSRLQGQTSGCTQKSFTFPSGRGGDPGCWTARGAAATGLTPSKYCSWGTATATART